MEIKELMMMEMRACWDFFQDNTNLDKSSKFFGLTKDKYPLSPEVASISSTGYMLGGLVIAVENKWISREEGYNIALGTLNTFLHLEDKNGFYHRYIDINTGKKAWNSEISIIDTGILICGILTAGEYFSGEVNNLADTLYKKVNWQWYTDKKRNMYRLGYKNRFYGYWDNYAEQLMLYVLGSGSPTYPVNNTFNRLEKDGIIYSWFGSLFTYQYSHAWLDLRDTIWFDNSVKATKVNIDYCNKQKMFKGYWGLSATITKNRYSQRLGAEPCASSIKKDGTLSISAMISSINFADISCALRLYGEFPESWGKYGFVTSFNPKNKWVSNEYLGIDKGTTMLMIANYFDRTIWKYLMKNKYIQEGMKKITE